MCRAFESTMRALAVVICVVAVSSAAHAQEDPLAPVAELVRRHADEAALSAIDRLPPAQRDTARARYLRGRLLERRSRMAEAAAAFPTGDDAAELPAAVGLDSARRAGAALARSGDCAGARELLEAQRRDPVVQARLAECALMSGDLPRAVIELTAVVDRGAGPVDQFAARFSLAEALTRSGRDADAVRVLTALVVERVDHPELERALTALVALNGGPLELSFTQQLRRVERLMEVHRYADAIEAIGAVPRPRRRPALRRWLHLRGMAFYRERHHYAEAAEVLTESSTMGGAHAAEDQFHAARALSRSDQDALAVRAYRRFATEHRSHRRAAEATYLAAWLELRHGMRGGERNMSRFVRSRLAASAPRFHREGTWQLGLRAFEARRYAAAERHLTAYARMSPDPLVRARGRYWLGRALQARGESARAIDAYRGALYVEPLHWYALLARQRLEELGVEAPPPFPDPPEPGPAVRVVAELPAEATFFAELGLRHDALAVLRRRERAMRRGPDGLQRLVAAYQQLGEAGRVSRLVGGASTLRRQVAPGPRDRWRWDGAYPRPYPRQVATAARAGGLTPAHLYAVMRQESGFDPDVVSYADAIGLMQLLPETAIPMAERVGLELTREMLFDPGVNTRIGAAYVGGLVARFGVPLAFAGFNAGGHRVDAWLARSGRQELDLFVEHIPFEQTRNYIRRVTTHLAHYRYLEDPEAGWPLTLPTHVEPR